MRNLEKKIGSFMIAVGAIIRLKGTDKILMMHRSGQDYQNDSWEPVYGRIDHHEELTTALQREVFEESGIKKLKILGLVRVWHIYRGEKDPDTEVYGLTFACETAQKTPVLSHEHDEYRWVTPDEAVQLIRVPGIKTDMQAYIRQKGTHVQLPYKTLSEKRDFNWSVICLA